MDDDASATMSYFVIDAPDEFAHGRHACVDLALVLLGVVVGGTKRGGRADGDDDGWLVVHEDDDGCYSASRAKSPLMPVRDRWCRPCVGGIAAAMSSSWATGGWSGTHQPGGDDDYSSRR